MKIKKIVPFMVIALLILPKIAYGYIDPGTGSFILTAVVGALAGIGLAVKIYFRKIVKFFKRIFGKDKEIEDDTNDNEAVEDDTGKPNNTKNEKEHIKSSR
jgi:signal peptidase I